jgi:hypothetical protein
MTSRGVSSVGSNDRQRDDLTVINGISPPRQDRLNEEFGVYTLGALATVTNETAKSVAKAITGVSLNMVKDWRAKAQKELSSRPVTEEEETDTNDEAKSPVTESEWKSFASFVVVVQARQMKDGTREQRIKVHHRETDKQRVWPDEDDEWPGMTSTQPWEWIVAQVGETEEVVPGAKERAPAEPKSAESPPARVPQTKIVVTTIHAYQPPDAEAPVGVGRAGELFRGTVRGSEPFALEASFELIETTGAEVAKERGSYRAKFYARNRSTGERIYLNDTQPEPLSGNKSHHTAKLPIVTLPRGNYKLQVLVTLQDPLSALGFLEVPMLQVV